MAHVPGVHDFQILPKIQLPKMRVHVLRVHDFQILLKIQLPNTVTSNQSDFLAFLQPVHVFLPYEH